MTHLWTSGEPIEVELDTAGVPRRFLWRGNHHTIDGIANTWRVDTGWWRVRIWREYFKLYTTSGLLVVVYHNLVNGQWHIQRLYD